MNNGGFGPFDPDSFGGFAHRMNNGGASGGFRSPQVVEHPFSFEPIPIRESPNTATAYTTLTPTHTLTHTLLQPASTVVVATQPYSRFDKYQLEEHLRQQQQQHQQQQQQQQKQRQQQQQSASLHNSMDDFMPPSFDPFFCLSSVQETKQEESWQTSLKLDIPDLSTEPISAKDAIERVRQRTDDVVNRYLPCADFLVACQQELRQAVAAATKKRLGMNTRQFFLKFILPLPSKFYQRNIHVMDSSTLGAAFEDVQNLCNEAKKCECQGFEAMKTAFLGGMKDGESWGLRKWLSKHGGGLMVCTDMELICRSAQKLDRDGPNTKKLADKMRPLASRSLQQLKSDIPQAYQAVSAAHPYLPFFHRLESALKGIADFDPEDDDVLIIDDHELEQMKAAAKKKDQNGRKRGATRGSDSGSNVKRKKTGSAVCNPLFVDDEPIEVIQPNTPAGVQGNDDKSWMCPQCFFLNGPESAKCSMCEVWTGDDGLAELNQVLNGTTDNDDFALAAPPKIPALPTTADVSVRAKVMVKQVEALVNIFDNRREFSVRPEKFNSTAFWNGRERYTFVLQLLATLLRQRDAESFIDPMVDDHDDIFDSGRPFYSNLIRHPVCFNDILSSLTGSTTGENGNNRESGELTCPGLSSWNMWNGLDLLEAIDLVFLNSLAYCGKSRTAERAQTNRMRKILWDGINNALSTLSTSVETRRRNTPTRRGETSGFVIFKQKPSNR